MNLNSKKLTIPDLISVGVFTAIYFVLATIATFSCALLPGVGNILLPAVAALISGSVYMLLAAKLQKFGGISIMGLVMGLFFFVSGHFVLSFAANIVCGVLADWVASRSQYRSKKVLLASYVIFSYGLTGPILPLWFMKDAYIANLTARGKDAAYIDTLFAPINNGSFVAASTLRKRGSWHEIPHGPTCQAVFAAAGQPDALFPCWDWGRGGSDRVVPAAVFPLRAHSHRHPVECGLLWPAGH